MGMNPQNIVDAGGLVIQHSSEEVSGKVQKYSIYMQEWTQDNLCPTTPRRRDTLSVTDGVVPPKCLQFQNVLKVHAQFWIFYHFRGPFGFVCEKLRHVGNLANLKNMII